MEPVRLSSIESIRRFHSFIFANPTSRAPHIYGLFVFNPDWSYGPNDNPLPANYLAAILEAATSLQFLSCATGFGHPVCRAVAKMTTLRELSVSSDWGSRARQPHPKALNILLTALRSPLQSLSINSYEEGQISASFFHDHLSHFAPTLESLKLQDFSFDISPSSVTTPFAALRSLKISSASYRPHCYKLDVLLRLFPNLDDTFFLSGSRVPTDQYSVLRQRSKETQKDHTWPGLDRVIYSANFAFLMALQCPIRCMDIDKSLFDEFDDHDGPALEDASYLAEALRDNCPQRLSVPLIFSCRDCLRGLDGLFPPAGMDNLTHLVVFAEIQISRTWRDRQTGRRTRFAWSQLLVRTTVTHTPCTSRKLKPTLTSRAFRSDPDMSPGRPRRLGQAQAPQADAPPRRLLLRHRWRL